jgi:hypothetical protein
LESCLSVYKVQFSVAIFPVRLEAAASFSPMKWAIVTLTAVTAHSWTIRIDRPENGLAIGFSEGRKVFKATRADGVFNLICD